MLGCWAQLAHAAGYVPPSLEGFKFKYKEEIDFDLDGINDELSTYYKNSKGDEIASDSDLKTGKVFAWSLATKGSDLGNPALNFTIIDFDGDGIFETRLLPEVGIFKLPSLDRYSFNVQWSYDFDGDGRKESYIKNYMAGNNESLSIFYKIDTSIMWGYSQKSLQEDRYDTHHNNGVIDSDGDGIFDVRYSLDSNIIMPDWVNDQACP
jgi:hypothetical protein